MADSNFHEPNLKVCSFMQENMESRVYENNNSWY